MTGEKSEGKMGDSGESSSRAPVRPVSSQHDVAAVIAYMRKTYAESHSPWWGLLDEVEEGYRIGYERALSDLADFMGFNLEENADE